MPRSVPNAAITVIRARVHPSQGSRAPHDLWSGHTWLTRISTRDSEVEWLICPGNVVTLQTFAADTEEIYVAARLVDFGFFLLQADLP